jgi:hypothetical protein
MMKQPGIVLFIFDVAQQVQDEAIATASAAENGSGGTLDGYSSAGFFAGIMDGGNREVAIVSSKAEPEIAWAAHFHTIKRDGVGHLRAALYKFTRRGA